MGRLILPILTLFLLSSAIQLRAQDQLSLHQSEYLPFISSGLNPALIADPKVYLSIHVVGVEAFAINDLAYYEGKNFSLGGLFNGRLDDSQENLNYKPKSGNMDLSAEGPAAFLSLGRSSIGLSARFRSHFNAIDVAPELSRFVFHGFRFFPQYDTNYKADGTNTSFMSWGELQLNFAHMIRVRKIDQINAGIAIKRLYGIGHVGLDVSSLDYRVTSQDIFISNFNGSYAISEFGFKGGNGWGADLGLVYKRMVDGNSDYIPFNKKARCVQSRYRYLLGLSVTDIGGVHFNKNAFQTDVVNGNLVWNDYIETEVADLGALDSLLSTRVENDQNLTTRENSYKVGLPRAVNIHGDVDLDKGLHVSAAVVFPWRTSKEFDLLRSTSFNMTPRYVKPRFEVGLPLSWIDYNTFRMGLGLRFHFLYLGSDDVLRLFDNEDVYSSDLYLGLHIPIYNRKDCGKGNGLRRGKLIAPCWGQ